MPFWIVLFICVVVAYFAVTEGAKKYFDTKLQVLFNLGLYQDCIDLLDRKLARIVMSTYKQYYLRFTIYEAADMDAYADRMLDHLLEMSCSDKQRRQLAVRAFNFYIKTGDRKRAASMLEEMRPIVSKGILADSQLTYDIVFCRRHDKIDEMEAMLDTNDLGLRGKLYLLLSYQYESSGNKGEARRYRNLEKQLRDTHRPPTIKQNTH